jgi:transcriptional antiterminator Rof (Rho-off)
VPGGSHFRAGAVTWSPTGSHFAASTVYTATVTLTAAAGYTFTGLAAANATINGNPASSVNVSAAGDTVTLTYTFPATGPAPATAITAAAVTGITAPATGGTPATTATVPGGSHFTAGAVTWSPTGSPFAPVTIYTATVTLTADTGYTFTGLANATINGNPASTINVSAAGDTVTLTYAFPATATAAITAADVTITAPVDGVAPSGTATLASGSHFTAGPVTWLPPDAAFVAGTTYTASVTLTADSGYTFTGLPTATLNGKPASTIHVSAAGDTVELTYTFAPLTPRGTGGGDAASVPTLGQWPLALLALLLGGMGFGAMRRKG